MSEEPVHFHSPFAFSSTGVAKVDVEDTPANILSDSYNVCVCPEGFREDLPEFGIPQLEFQTVPMKLQELEAAINRWEPRAGPEITEQAAELTNQSSRVLTIEVG